MFASFGLKRLVLQCINGVSSNPVEGRTKICRLKDLILTLFGLIFRRICIWGVGSLRYSDTIPLSPWPYPIITMTLSYHHHDPIPSSPWFYPIITITLSHHHHDPILSSPWPYPIIAMALSYHHHDPIHGDNGIVSLYRNDPTPHIHIRLKIKPNSVRIRSLSRQIFVLPSTGFELMKKK
jgi:hypothetical protein